MKMTLVLCLMLMTSSVMAANFKVTPTGSKVGFEVVKFKIGSTVPGAFKTFEGKATLDEGKGALSDVNVSIDTASVNTEDAKRDEHLRSPDFFDAEKFPKITFVSTGTATVAPSFELKGNLTIKGVTKPVVLKVTKAETKENAYVFNATTVINRLDYGITWNKAMEKSDWKTVLGVLGKSILDDKVTIKLDVKLEN